VVTERHGTWGTAMRIPGLFTLNAGGEAEVDAVSCGSPGNCAVGGTYLDRRGHHLAFVASERNGIWTKAIEIPGLAALSTGRSVYPIVSLSCASAGNCSAGGAYELRSFRVVAFVVDELQGTWGSAHRVPAIDALDARGDAEVTAISCGTPGSCSAVGDYSRGRRGVVGPISSRVFVAVESHGIWRSARALPGLAALQPRLPYAAGISCGSAGNCAVAGSYISRSGNGQSFVANEVDGTWAPAQHVAGPRPRRHGADLTLDSVSCAARSDCAVGGSYERRSLLASAMVAEERHGKWGRARVLTGPGRLGPYAGAEIFSMSCASAGNCSAGGDFFGRSGHIQPFVVSERDGSWGRVIEVPGSRALDVGRNAYVASVSCGAPGDCAAGGAYSDSKLAHAFVVTEQNGNWGRARAVIGP
jgi:hypothetical protein